MHFRVLDWGFASGFGQECKTPVGGSYDGVSHLNRFRVDGLTCLGLRLLGLFWVLVFRFGGVFLSFGFPAQGQRRWKCASGCRSFGMSFSSVVGTSNFLSGITEIQDKTNKNKNSTTIITSCIVMQLNTVAVDSSNGNTKIKDRRAGQIP